MVTAYILRRTMPHCDCVALNILLNSLCLNFALYHFGLKWRIISSFVHLDDSNNSMSLVYSFCLYLMLCITFFLNHFENLLDFCILNVKWYSFALWMCCRWMSEKRDTKERVRQKRTSENYLHQTGFNTFSSTIDRARTHTNRVVNLHMHSQSQMNIAKLQKIEKERETKTWIYNLHWLCVGNYATEKQAFEYKWRPL